MVEEMLLQTEDTVLRIEFTTLEMTELMVFIMLEMKLEIAFQTDVTTLEIVLNVVEIAE